jgi:hypothetical protein
MDSVASVLRWLNRDWQPTVYAGKSQAQLKREHEEAAAFNVWHDGVER